VVEQLMPPAAPPADAAGVHTVIVRPAVSADAAAIAKVRIETWRAAYRGMLPEDILRGLDQNKATVFFQAAIDDREADNHVLSGFDGNQLCGFALWNRSAEEPSNVAELRAIYVLPSHQGTGLGSALFEHCRIDMRRAGFSAFLVYTLETNAPAREFYRRRGGVALPDRRVFEMTGTSQPEIGFRIALSGSTKTPLVDDGH